MTNNTCLKGVGIDTTNLRYELSEETYFNYIHTSIGANNESLISNWTDTYQTVPLITSIGFLDNFPVLVNHLQELHRVTIDLLLVDASCDFGSNTELIKEQIESGIVGEIGIRNPESVEQLEEIRRYLKFEKVALDINPFNFNYDIVKWCDDNDIMIVGFNPFGGRINSGKLIETFGVQYLLGFASKYVDLLLLSGSDALLSSEDAEILVNEYLAKPKENDTDYEEVLDIFTVDDTRGVRFSKDEFLVTKSIDKLEKTPKPLVHTVIKVDENTKVPCNLKYNIFGREDITNHFNPQKETLEGEEKETELSKKLKTLIDTIHKPIDIKTDTDWISVVRLRILSYLGSMSKITRCLRVGENAFVLNVVSFNSRRAFFGLFESVKIVETELYLLYIDSSRKINIRMLNNGNKTS